MFRLTINAYLSYLYLVKSTDERLQQHVVGLDIACWRTLYTAIILNTAYRGTSPPRVTLVT